MRRRCSNPALAALRRVDPTKGNPEGVSTEVSTLSGILASGSCRPLAKLTRSSCLWMAVRTSTGSLIAPRTEARFAADEPFLPGTEVPVRIPATTLPRGLAARTVVRQPSRTPALAFIRGNPRNTDCTGVRPLCEMTPPGIGP